MFTRGIIQNTEDYFKELNQRPDKCIYFYRMNGYNDKCRQFIGEYAKEARKSGVVIEGKIANPTEQNLSYYEEIMGMDFQMSMGFLLTSLKKWLPRMNDYQRENVAAAFYDTLDAMRKEGKNENMLKNAYIKFMCWFYYKFECMVNNLGENNVPKILYEGTISNYELKILDILAGAGCDILLLQYQGDAPYQKLDAGSKISKELVLENMQPFPEGFSLKNLREDMEKEKDKVRLYGTLPTVHACTNAWIHGEGLEDFKMAARLRGEALDHVLLHGPPGLGKTTLSNIIANELGVGFKVTSGPVLDKPGDLAGVLTSLEPNDVLFIDEIHRLSPVVEEYLYSAMEDYRIDIMIDKGPSARSIQIDLNPFTLVGATTRSGLLTAPLRARFGINLHLEYYDDDILSNIIRRSASILDVPCSVRAASEIASRSRGTPRIANALLRRVRDFAQVKGSGSIDTEIAQFALEALNIDKYGLDEIDNKILCTIIDKFKGGPVGITTIATALGEDAGTIEEVYEPFLIKEGFMKRTPRGREVTELAYKHLGRSLYNSQKTLFND